MIESMEIESIMKPDELELLTYLHQHVHGYGPRFVCELFKIKDVLEWEQERADKAASFLAEWGLIGVNSWFEKHVARIHLTGAGEAFVRRAEEKLETAADEASGWERGKALTIEALRSGGLPIAIAVASQVLMEYAKIWLPGLAGRPVQP